MAENQDFYQEALKAFDVPIPQPKLEEPAPEPAAVTEPAPQEKPKRKLSPWWAVALCAVLCLALVIGFGRDTDHTGRGEHYVYGIMVESGEQYMILSTTTGRWYIDLNGKDAIIIDDMIASGESMLDIAYELKKRKARRIFAYATYATFTAGLDKFDQAYDNGILDGVFGTNLTYRSPDLLKRKWFHEVDCSKYIAYYIAALNHNISISALIDSHEKIQNLLDKKREF